MIVVVATLVRVERGLAVDVLVTIGGGAVCVVVVVLWSRWGRRLAAEGRRRRRRTLYALVILISVGWAAFNGLEPVLARWANGVSTEKSRLGFTTMLWWGRIGKGLQFVAGLVVLLDLADPDRLREAGKRARLRQRGIDPKMDERRSTDTYIRTAAWLYEHIVTHPPQPGPPIGGIQRLQRGDPVLVDAGSVADVPGGAPFSLLDYHVLHARFSGEVDGRAITSNDEKRLYDMVWDLMTERLTAEETARLHRARGWRAGLARLLDRERPAHPLRWFGLFLFTYGFALDLLAS
ncbi:hypothetical protein [Nonomuraea sp. NPDC050643]|uniref:hypothetical protein n=1 Tax=Nonomuraea sp. NPDC050643 TaxID=3155660 RepID=UPI0033EDDCA9